MISSSTNASRPSSSAMPALLRDQLAQFSGGGRTSAPAFSGRSALGWFLTFCGLGVSGWVLFSIHAAIFHPEKIGLPLRLLKVDDLNMTIPSGKIQLPPVAVTLAAYLVSAILIAIAGKIAVALLKLGTSLVLGGKIGPSGALPGVEDGV